MDSRGNMSSQHRRSKVNHSVIMGPELTEEQDRVAKSRKRLSKMTVEELTVWLTVCEANVAYWKNRRSIRKKWEETASKVEKEISHK